MVICFKEAVTTRIVLAAAEVRVDDDICNGAGSNAHPTRVWETITEVGVVDGLIFDYRR